METTHPHGGETGNFAFNEDSPLLWEHDPSLFSLNTLAGQPADTDSQTNTDQSLESHGSIRSADLESSSSNNISRSSVTAVQTIQPADGGLPRYSHDSNSNPRSEPGSPTNSIGAGGQTLSGEQDSSSLRSPKNPRDNFEVEEQDQRKTHSIRIYQPVFLGWAGFFVFVIIGLEVLRRVSEKNQGIVSVSQDYNYLWRYGLSFFLGIMAAFWGQQEYRIRQMMPWIDLKDGKGEIQQSLDLNYITISTPEAIYASFRAKHFSVTSAITTSLLFRALTILSTALLSLEYLHMVRDNTVVLLDRLDLEKSNGITPTRAVSRYWAIHQFNSSYTAGTTPEFATQSLAPVDGESSSIISFPAEVFTATLKDCEAFHWHSSDFFNSSTADCSPDYFFQYPVDVETPHCVLKYLFKVDCIGPWLWEVVDAVDCHQKNPAENNTHMLIFRTMTSFELSPPSGLTPPTYNLTGLICKPEYYYTQSWISSGMDTSRMYQMTEALNFTNTYQVRRELANTITSEILFFDQPAWLGTWFQMANQTSKEYNLENMNDPNAMTEAFVRTFQEFAPQWAKATRSFPQNVTVHGSISERVPRLCAQIFTVNLMEIILVFMTIFVVIISFHPKVLPTERPATLALHALKLSVLEKSLPPRRPDQSPFWQPTSVRTLFRTATLIIPPLLIVAIETILQYSMRANGMAYVSLGGYTKYVWVYAPSIAMAIVGLLFYLLGNGAKQIDQFQDLYYNRPGVNAILRDPLGTPTIPLIVKSFKDRRFSLGIILVASTAASLLTTIASGLYDSWPISVNQNVPLELQNWYQDLKDISAYYLPQTGGGTVTSLIAFENISYPQWTHEEFAFPEFTVSDRHGTRNQSSGLKLRAQIPAVRAQMNCTLDRFLASLDVRRHRTVDGVNLANVDLPVTCGLGNETLGGPWNHLSFVGNTVDDPNSSRFFATSADESFGPAGKAVLAVGRLTESRIEDTSVVCCQPYNEVLFVDVTLAVPEYIIDASKPPFPHEESSEYLCPFPGTLFTFVDFAMSKFFGDSINGTADFDAFFGELIYGRDGTPFDEIFGLENAPRLVQAMNRQFQIVAAQLNHEHFAPLQANFTQFPEYPYLTNLSGNLTETRFRLKQSAISSRILEGLLAFMVVCAGISFLLGGGTKVLREDPGSIGAKMRLFVGSEMIKRFPEDTENWDEKDLLKSGIFEGAVFRLGWWGGGDDGNGEQGRGEAEDEEDGDGSEGCVNGRFGIDIVDDEKVE